MSKVLCFGELLQRMSPVMNQEWIRKGSMPVYIGGAELNVAQALSQWNIPVKYCSALPDHSLAREIVEYLNSRNIDISGIQFCGNRIGIYYLPQGADLRNTGVIYDRDHSSFAELKPGTLDWDQLLHDINWFHFSAINPSLNKNLAAICKEALEAASTKGIHISVDLNYRSKLWQYGKSPMDVMPELIQYCHVLMGNLWAVESMLGIVSPVKESIGKTNAELQEAAGKSMWQVHNAYPKLTDIAYTFRLESSYFGILQHGPERVVSKDIGLKKTIDKVGTGDCFMAGLIYGLIKNNFPQHIIDFASMAAVGKLYELGDATRRSEEEIEALMNENNIA